MRQNVIAAEMRGQGLSVVLGTYNRKSFLKLTIGSVRKELDSTAISHEIIVVDGGSTDGTISWLARQKDIVSIIQHNRGKWRGKPIERRTWGYFMNLGFKCAQGKYICMLSDDCLLVPGAIHNGLAYAQKRLSAGVNLGAVAFYFIRNYPRGTEYVVIREGDHVYVNHGIYLNEALRSVGYVDEDSYQFYAADVDLCFRMISKGYSVEACPESKVVHFGHINVRVRISNKRVITEDARVFRAKWAHMLQTTGREPLPHLATLLNHPFTTREIRGHGLTLTLAIMHSQALIRLLSSRTFGYAIKAIKRHPLAKKLTGL